MNKDFKKMYLVTHQFLFNKALPPSHSPLPPPTPVVEEEQLPLSPPQEDQQQPRPPSPPLPLRPTEEERTETNPRKRRNKEPIFEEDEGNEKRMMFETEEKDEGEEEVAVAKEVDKDNEQVREKEIELIKTNKKIGRPKTTCYICNKKFNTHTGFKKHVNIVHDGNRINKDKLVVSVPKKFEVISDIKNLKPFHCAYCGMNFKNHSQHDQHMKVKHDIAPIVETQRYKRGIPRTREVIKKEFMEVN